jgi:hypothetical protein
MRPSRNSRKSAKCARSICPSLERPRVMGDCATPAQLHGRLVAAGQGTEQVEPFGAQQRPTTSTSLLQSLQVARRPVREEPVRKLFLQDLWCIELADLIGALAPGQCFDVAPCRGQVFSLAHPESPWNTPLKDQHRHFSPRWAHSRSARGRLQTFVPRRIQNWLLRVSYHGSTKI